MNRNNLRRNITTSAILLTLCLAITLLAQHFSWQDIKTIMLILSAIEALILAKYLYLLCRRSQKKN